MAAPTPIESRSDYQTDENPSRGEFAYWRDELKGAQHMLKRWHRQADRINARYLDARQATATDPMDPNHATQSRFRLNLFHSNVYTQFALLYGKLPRIEVKRRYSDPTDDVGRIASTLLERLLNNDIEDDPESTDALLRAVLQDRLIPGLGVARVRYDATFAVEAEVTAIDGTPVEAEAEVLDEEFASTDYYHWRDVLWSWSRDFANLRWVAFRNYLSREEATERYGEDVVRDFEFKQQKLITSTEQNDAPDQPDNNEPWLRAEVWEIWDKDRRQVLEVHLNHDRVLNPQDDPLELTHFFPCPPFYMANPTTSLYRPTPDFHLAQDLYNEVDKLQTRIAIITEACKVVGVYDASTPEVARMMKETVENDLIPVDKWAMFAEKGGLQGQIDWFPIEAVVNALVNLRQLRDETIELLYQVTGMSDVMRGQLANQYEGVGQTEQKTQFASVRMQHLQESFASFVSNLFQLKAEVIARHFSPATILERANAEELPEAQTNPELVAQAVALIKSPKDARLRIKVDADSMALMDYRRLQAERTEYLGALATFMQAAAPLTEQAPTATPHLLRMLQWGLAGFRGADEVEGILDDAIDAHNAAQEQAKGQPDPAVAQEQAKIQGQAQLIQAKAQAAMETRAHDLQADMQTEQQKHQLEMQKVEAEFRQQLALIQAKANADMATEQFQSQVNAEQHAAGVEAEMHKDVVAHRLSLDEDANKVALEIRKLAVASALKPTETSNDET